MGVYSRLKLKGTPQTKTAEIGEVFVVGMTHPILGWSGFAPNGASISLRDRRTPLTL